MKYNRLGRNSLSVSELGFGTAQIGGPSVIKGKPFGAKPVSDNEASKILTQAYDAGINVYDSSDMYGDGLAEKRLGEFFKKRDDVVFATKCGFTRNGNRCFSKDYVMKSVEDSLRRLKRERIDLYQFSKPTLTDSNNYDLEKTVMRLKKQGKIAYAGISVGRIEDGLGFLKQHIWDSLQIIYNLLTLDFKKLISEACAKKIGIIIRSPLSSGMLTGKLGENTKFSESDDRSAFMYGDLLHKRLRIVDAIKERFNLSNEELVVFSLNFLISDPEVTTIIPGATSVSQMEVNLRVLNKPRFSTNEWNEVYDFAQNMAENVNND